MSAGERAYLGDGVFVEVERGMVKRSERRRALVAELRELPGVVCDPVTGVLTRDRFWLVVLTDGLELERARGRRVGIVWLDPDVSEDARSVARQVLA